MTLKNSPEQDVRHAIDELIQTATNYDVDVLERIYHDDLQVVMIDTQHNGNSADKVAFTDLIKTKRPCCLSPHSLIGCRIRSCGEGA